MSRTVDGTFGLTKNQPPTVTRPFDFGTDAIERQRVSLGQSIIDADFEYGLQATKWQTYQEIRKMPSFYEIPGTDIAVTSVTTDATTPSIITVNINTALTTIASTLIPTGSVISISGFANAQRNADRAEGFFIVRTVTGSPNASAITYEARGLVGTNGQIISTSYTTLRRGNVYTNSTSYLPFTNAVGSGTNVTVSFPVGTSHGILPGTPIQTANTAVLTGITPGESLIGNFIVATTPSSNTFTFAVPVSVSGTQNNGTEGFRIYTSPYSYAIHRPFDGGVILSPGQPSFGASAMRQSKKVFRYQSGKGLLWSSGTLFCPNNDVTYVSVVGQTIQIVCDVPHGSPQAGAVIQLKGISTPGYNGTYTVSSIVDSRTLQVTPVVLPTLTPAVLGDQPRFVMTGWYGASVRAGCFEDQNGLFWEWDGQTLWAVKRSSTFQTAGYVTATTGSSVINGDFSDTINFPTASIDFTNAVVAAGVPVGSSNVTMTGLATTGTALLNMQNQGTTVTTLFGSNVYISNVISGTSLTFSFPPVAASITQAQIRALSSGVVFQYPNTRFIDQLRVNDKVVIRGMTHTVVQIQTQGTMIVNPPYRGASSITVPVKMCKVKEVRTPQSQFNRDTLDGTGPSGFKFDPTKMQMIGLQYTWYGAGFVDFMMRGGDGNWVYAHRYKQNNINDEAYMRTGNMPVRYELINESISSSSALAVPLGTAETTLTLTEAPTYWPPSGNVIVDNELMTYNGKSGTTLTGVTRAASLRYNVNDQNYTLTASAAAQTHQAGSTALLVGTTCTPSLTHWGSAFIMDGQFDSDRGYFFNYSNTSTVQLTTGQSSNVFMIRLAPTVSNGIVGDMGQRELLNRAQLLLQKLEVIPGAASSTTSIVNVTGILNPSGINPASVSWSNVNSTVFGSQPSFTQIGILGALGANYINGTGERIFSTIAPSGAQNTIDLSSLKELSNTVIGGNGIFPDGPDTLMIQLTSVAGTVTNCNTNLFWTEAQA
jgi:hypothetical protein